MRTFYALPLSDNYPSCIFRQSEFFCQMAPAELKAFDTIKTIAAFPAGAVLFLEQQPARGIFQICTGAVKLSITSDQGKQLILRTAGPGDVLGMAAVLSGTEYEATAETLRPCQLGFVSDGDFWWYVSKYPAAFLRAANYLALQYVAACEQLSAVGLGASVVDRLVRFLLKWPAKEDVGKNRSRFVLSLSHEQIGACIGVSRESISRTLSLLKKRGLIIRRRSTLVIPDRTALAAFRLCQTRPSGVGSELVRLPPVVLKHQPRGIRRPEWQPCAHGRSRA